MDDGEAFVSLDDGLDGPHELFDLAEILCMHRGVATRSTRFFIPDEMQQFNSRLRCGQLSLPRLIKPIVGPALNELTKQITDNKECFRSR